MLRNVRSVAAVGVSPKDVRPSYFVFRYMHLRGYKMIPVNPMHAGKTLFGQPIYGDLSEIPKDQPVDMVNVFRRSEFVPDIYDNARRHLPGLKALWLQIGVIHDETIRQAEQDGLDAVQDRCPKMEYQRLFGELRKAGINTRIISSRLPPF
ncbi:CoA-binding protein [Candidatus Rhodobacter oscarellae]|nr:CoA-binding protein [Candidatus Rhodobacter lobularis]